MRQFGKFSFYLVCAFCFAAMPVQSQHLRDGKIFDQGKAMTQRAENAPKELDKMAFAVGQWDVTYSTYLGDSLAHTAVGQAEITYMNRGHAFMERFQLDDLDGIGTPLSTMAFLTYSPSFQTWGLGEANSLSESISVLNGDFDGEHLRLQTVARIGGGMKLTYLRGSYQKKSDSQFDFIFEVSKDDGLSWQKQIIKSYRKRNPQSDFLAPSSGFGNPAPHLPEQARQFDFLIGVFDATQELTLPNGQQTRFPSTSTATYALNGHAILEYNWYDVDRSLPDAATSIIRIYNRAMRRWESLYLANRGNNLLYFGGRQEGNQLVLHLFSSNTLAPRISRFVFHSAADDSYGWFAETSTDHGKSFAKTWTIDFIRKQ